MKIIVIQQAVDERQHQHKHRLRRVINNKTTETRNVVNIANFIR